MKKIQAMYGEITLHMLVLSAVIFLAGCQSQSRNDSYAHVAASSIEAGRKLAETHCQSCHQLPDPALLDGITWETGALPAMGPYLGVYSYKGQSYDYHGDPQMKGPGFLSDKSSVTVEEWESIVDYYTATSPDQLPDQDRRETISMQLPLYEIYQPKLNYRNTHSSLVKITSVIKTPLVVSDANTLETYFLNSQFSPVDSLTTDGPVVGISFAGEGEGLVCNVGTLVGNNEAHGSVERIHQSSDKWKKDSVSVLSELRRPLEILQSDLNGDGKADYLVCEFGYMNGGLSWMENTGDGRYRNHILSRLPGALKAYPHDYNKDGMIDILALFAQGEEGIFLYTNKGNGTFEEKRLMRFPAVYGSSYFELADFNEDGMIDILYTSGDNADYTSILKPYHGVYIFLNRGEDNFEQSFFFPIHGCYKAMAMDFDKDGDLDVATIAYYADFATQPQEGFVYLENEGELRFKPYSSAALEAGRWITMDVGDIDDDGWVDIALGNFVKPSKLAKTTATWITAPPILILKNKGR